MVRTFVWPSPSSSPWRCGFRRVAQGETTSAIVGSVTDPAGAAIPGATVTVTNVENGLKRSVKTDDSGRFSFPQLKPGTYSVKAEADRFEAQQNNTVSAGLGQKQTVDFKLNIASASAKHRGAGAGAADQPGESQYLDDPDRPIHRRPSESGRRHDVSAAVCRGRAHQHRRQRQRLRRRHERLWQRAVQWLAVSFERLYRRWPGNQRSADQPEQRPFDQSGAGIEFDRGGDGQHASPTRSIRAGMALLRSTMSRNPAPTGFTETCTSCGTARSSMRRISLRTPPPETTSRAPR